MTEVNVTKMQVTAYYEDRIRKWFFDNAPYPLPNVGDFIDTIGGTYYTADPNDKVPHFEREGVLVRIVTRTFIRTDNYSWTVLISGES